LLRIDDCDELRNCTADGGRDGGGVNGVTFDGSEWVLRDNDNDTRESTDNDEVGDAYDNNDDDDVEGWTLVGVGKERVEDDTDNGLVVDDVLSLIATIAAIAAGSGGLDGAVGCHSSDIEPSFSLVASIWSLRLLLLLLECLFFKCCLLDVRCASVINVDCSRSSSDANPYGPSSSIIEAWEGVTGNASVNNNGSPDIWCCWSAALISRNTSAMREGILRDAGASLASGDVNVYNRSNACGTSLVTNGDVRDGATTAIDNLWSTPGRWPTRKWSTATPVYHHIHSHSLHQLSSHPDASIHTVRVVVGVHTADRLWLERLWLPRATCNCWTQPAAAFNFSSLFSLVSVDAAATSAKNRVLI
jgi:hypothetical protein